jgi:hypothetical protein
MVSGVRGDELGTMIRPYSEADFEELDDYDVFCRVDRMSLMGELPGGGRC